MTIGALRPLVLASESEARRKLLAAACIDAAVEPAAIDEGAIKRQIRAEGGSADRCALALAEAKVARASRLRAGALVIGADEILKCGGEWLDKPHDLAEARGQLRLLRGRSHALICAVAAASGGDCLWRHVERAHLVMRPFDGDYFAILGLPPLPLMAFPRDRAALAR